MRWIENIETDTEPRHCDLETGYYGNWQPSTGRSELYVPLIEIRREWRNVYVAIGNQYTVFVLLNNWDCTVRDAVWLVAPQDVASVDWSAHRHVYLACLLQDEATSVTENIRCGLFAFVALTDQYFLFTLQNWHWLRSHGYLHHWFFYPRNGDGRCMSWCWSCLHAVTATDVK